MFAPTPITHPLPVTSSWTREVFVSAPPTSLCSEAGTLFCSLLCSRAWEGALCLLLYWLSGRGPPLMLRRGVGAWGN